MTRITTTRRPASLGLTLMIALVSALAALALSGGNDAAAHGNHAAAVTASPKALSLYRAMDRLWEEHIVWTRLAIIDLTTDAPGTKETVTRLLRNQTDIGNAVKPFYGAGAGNKLTSS